MNSTSSRAQQTCELSAVSIDQKIANCEKMLSSCCQDVVMLTLPRNHTHDLILHLQQPESHQSHVRNKNRLVTRPSNVYYIAVPVSLLE